MKSPGGWETVLLWEHLRVLHFMDNMYFEWRTYATIVSVPPAFHCLCWPVLQLPDSSTSLLLSQPVYPQPCSCSLLKHTCLCPTTAERPPVPFVPGSQSNLWQPLRSITVRPPTCSSSLPATILQTYCRFSQLCIFIHHIHCGPSMCKELGMSTALSRAQLLSSWHLEPLHMLLSMPAMPSLLSCLKCSAFNIQQKTHFLHQHLSALLGRAFLPHFISYYIIL